MKKLLTSALMLGVLALAGCGAPGDDTEAPAAGADGTAPDAGTATGADTAAPAAGYEDEAYACGLLSRADMEALFGGPVGEAQPNAVGTSRFCQWKDASAESWVYLELAKPSNGAAKEYATVRKVRPEAKDVSGLGQKAYSYYHRGQTEVKVLAGDLYVTVAVQYLKGRTLTPEADVARVTTLARQVVGRM
ncbi:DUF3558 family protein [Actinoplanes sp. NPDC049681]|uniref:DUF3558 family protein n=1 Tax=Actinoplanes sp. NPDC049681 TaxID=3363905 RepID=UPI003791DF28